MQAYKTAILATSLVALAGCASWDKSPVCPKTHGWQAWSDTRCNPPEAPRDLAAELAEAQQQNDALSRRVSDLERQIADRDREIAALRSSAGDSAKLANQLSSAQSDLDQSQQRTRDRHVVGVSRDMHGLLREVREDGSYALQRIGTGGFQLRLPRVEEHAGGQVDDELIAGLVHGDVPRLDFRLQRLQEIFFRLGEAAFGLIRVGELPFQVTYAVAEGAILLPCCIQLIG